MDQHGPHDDWAKAGWTRRRLLHTHKTLHRKILDFDVSSASCLPSVLKNSTISKVQDTEYQRFLFGIARTPIFARSVICTALYGPSRAE